MTYLSSFISNIPLSCTGFERGVPLSKIEFICFIYLTMTKGKHQKFRIVRKYAKPSPAQYNRLHAQLQLKRNELKRARARLSTYMASLSTLGYQFYHYSNTGWYAIDKHINDEEITEEQHKEMNNLQSTIQAIKSEIKEIRDKLNPSRVQYRELEEKNYQAYKKISENYDDTMMPCTELDAIEKRQNDELISIHGPRVPREEEKKDIQARIELSEAKLIDALENVKKLEKARENIASLKTINDCCVFEAKISPALSLELNTLLQDARNTALALEIDIDRLKASMNPQTALKERMQQYEEADDQDLTLSEFLRLKQKRYRIRKMQIIRVCVDRYCDMNRHNLPTGLRCVHIDSDDQVIPCDCLYDLAFGICECEQRPACNCVVLNREMSEKNRKLYNLGVLEIEDSAYVQQYQLAKQGRFDNYEWIRDWCTNYKHRKRIASFVYNLSLAKRL